MSDFNNFFTPLKPFWFVITCSTLDEVDLLVDMVGALAMELPGLFQSAHMGQFTQDGENGQNVAFFYFFEAPLWPNGLIFSTFLNCSEEILTGAF